MLRIVDPQAQGTAPAGTPMFEKILFWVRLDPNQKISFCHSDELLGDLDQTLDSNNSDTSISFHLSPCLVRCRPEGAAKSEKQVRKPGVD